MCRRSESPQGQGSPTPNSLHADHTWPRDGFAEGQLSAGNYIFLIPYWFLCIYYINRIYVHIGPWCRLYVVLLQAAATWFKAHSNTERLCLRWHYNFPLLELRQTWQSFFLVRCAHTSGAHKSTYSPKTLFDTELKEISSMVLECGGPISDSTLL